MKIAPPKWIGFAFGIVGVVGLILMARPDVGVVVIGLLCGVAGLVLFAAVMAGRFDPPAR